MKVMTPEFDSRIADWLEDDPDKAPSIVLETVVGALPSIPQRHSWRSLLRFNQMPRFSIAAVALLVTAVGVSAWMAGNRGGVGSLPTPAPTVAPTAAATATPAPPTPAATMRVLSGLDQGSDLRAGTYVIGSPFSVPLAITVEDDWQLGQLETNVANLRGPQTTIDLLRPETVYADACDPDSATPVGSSVDQVTSALTSIEGFTAGPVADVIVDGLTGKTFTLDNSIDMQICAEGPRLLTFDRFGIDEPAFASPNDHDRIWVLDVDGEPLVIDVRTYDDVTEAEQAQADGLIDSIDFD
jgi:hypothetical protein